MRKPPTYHTTLKNINNIDCALNLTNSKTLCSLWKNSFMDNEMKTFCFKLHNNTLGYNYTVNKFIRNHNAYCTFCTLSREPEDGRETPYHIFFCMQAYGADLRKNFQDIFRRRIQRDDKNKLLWRIRLRQCLQKPFT